MPPSLMSDVADTATVWDPLGVARAGWEFEVVRVRVDDTLRSLVALVAIAVVVRGPSVLTAQSLEPLPIACKGQIVSRIEVHTRPPFEIGGSKVQQRLARQVTALHATTNPEILRRFLALAPGEP